MDNPQPPPMPPRSRGNNKAGCLLAAVAVQFVLLLALIAHMAGISEFFSGHASEPGMYGADEFPSLEEVWSNGNGKYKVVKIPLRGMILLNQPAKMFSSGGSAVTALQSIRRATLDEEVNAIILDVDSGGGGITASDVIYKALLDFKEAQEGRKIVAIYGDMAASGAYYVSMAADHIVARPTTVTGSIGVLIQSFNIRDLGEKIGLKDVTIKSGRNKDLLSPFQELSEEDKLPEERRRIMQGVIDEMYEHFVGVVAAGRGMEEEKVRELADGRIFTANKALEAGLVDEIGYWDDAMQKTADLLGVPEVRVYRYEVPFSFAALIHGAQRMDPVSGFMDRIGDVKLMYRFEL